MLDFMRNFLYSPLEAHFLSVATLTFYNIGGIKSCTIHGFFLVQTNSSFLNISEILQHINNSNFNILNRRKNKKGRMETK